MSRIAIVHALEALEEGDIDLACAILLGALEGRGVLPPPCRVCGATAWPGDLARHILSAHREPRRAA